jgi:hypothetical protein
MTFLRDTARFMRRTALLFWNRPQDFLALTWHHWMGNTAAADRAYDRLTR